MADRRTAGFEDKPGGMDTGAGSEESMEATLDMSDITSADETELRSTLIPKGAHGIHIHAVGVCEPAGKFATAGGHFNPGNKQHGLNNPAGPHAGDLPQIDTKTVEQGYYTTTTKAVSLTSGPASIFDADGTALVIHASADDQVTDPTGNSGDRIACAVLAAPNPALATPTPRPPTAGAGTATDANGTSRTVAIAALFALAAGATVAGLRRFAR